VIYPSVLALGVVAIGLGCTLWAYKKLHRIAAWLMGFGAFVLTVAVVPWRNALAALVASPSGLVVLFGVTAVAFICFVFEAIAKHKHHRIRTPVIAATLGVTLVMAYADLNVMLASLGKSTSTTGSALSAAVKTIRSGAAAKAATHSHDYVILALGVGLLVAIVFLGIRLDAKKSAAGHPILGRRPGALPPVRPLGALTRGKARR
jgi:hypothetical protein